MRALFLPVLFALAAPLTVAATTAVTQAETLEKLTDGGRYQLMEINDKIVRLDTKSGRFELCHMEAEEWSCLVAKDERRRLLATISDLSSRVAALESAQQTGQTEVVQQPLKTPAAEVAPTNSVAAAAEPQSVAPQVSERENLVPAASIPPVTGTPVDISPGAIAEAEADANTGIVGRITGVFSNLGW